MRPRIVISVIAACALLPEAVELLYGDGLKATGLLHRR